MRVIYLRTSTDKQDGAAQRSQLAAAADARGWLKLGPDQVDSFEDVGQSGKNSIRPGLDKLRRLARNGMVDEVLVTAIDRLGRSSVEVCLLVDELARADVVIHSLREGTLDAHTPVGRFGIQIIAALAEMEHGLIRERVMAGQKRAREKGTRSGKPIGRPKRDVSVEKLYEAFKARQEGKSWRKISMAVKVPLPTLRRRLGVSKTTHPRAFRNGVTLKQFEKLTSPGQK